jgi:hypothetical protein
MVLNLILRVLIVSLLTVSCVLLLNTVSPSVQDDVGTESVVVNCPICECDLVCPDCPAPDCPAPDCPAPDCPKCITNTAEHKCHFSYEGGLLRAAICK